MRQNGMKPKANGKKKKKKKKNEQHMENVEQSKA